MFMFRPRRNALVKRLWRSAAARASRTDQLDLQQQQQQQQPLTQQVNSSGGGGGGGGGGAGANWQRATVLKAATHALLKRLSDDQLAALVDAVDSAGAAPSPCLHLDAETVNKTYLEPAHLVLCRIFRWPELHSSGELKRITSLCAKSASSASSASECPSSSACCNPYHWSRLSPTDGAPASYSRLLMNLERPGRVTTSFPVESLETGGTNQFSSSMTNLDGGGGGRVRPWCTLAYWELRQRVGRLFPVTQPSVAIFTDAKVQDGLCLSALTGHRAPETDAVRRTRQKVGLGLLLCQESDGVWMYNRSDSAVFVNSPTLDPRAAPGSAGAPRTLLVYKVPPSFAIRIFDYERSIYDQLRSKGHLVSAASSESLWKCQFEVSSSGGGGGGGSVLYRSDDKKLPMDNLTAYKEEFSDGPFDPNALRISFAKGWGPKYSRQFITSCPCWIEVLLAPCR